MIDAVLVEQQADRVADVDLLADLLAALQQLRALVRVGQAPTATRDAAQRRSRSPTLEPLVEETPPNRWGRRRSIRRRCRRIHTA